MDALFWKKRWQERNIGFHSEEANPMLVAHFDALGLQQGQRVFVPLCGKTLDIAWLLAQGMQVVGAELVESAVQELFGELGVQPDITSTSTHKRYGAEGVVVFVGDLFALTADALDTVDAVYDRAAMVALPAEMRGRYAKHLMAITATAPQLLITYEYEQSGMEGPPFSITDAEVQAHYAAHYQIECLADQVVEGRLKARADGLVIKEQVRKLQ